MSSLDRDLGRRLLVAERSRSVAWTCTFKNAAQADRYLRERGYLLGAMEARSPRAIMHRSRLRESTVPKWTHIDASRRRPRLDGVEIDGTLTITPAGKARVRMYARRAER